MNILKAFSVKRRPINLFFTELIIALLFFSISGAVIIKVFASADNKTRLNSQKEKAMICAQSIAEVFSESGSAESAFGIVFSGEGSFDENGSFGIVLDNLCRPAADGTIILTASEEREKTVSGVMSRLTVSFACGDTELYTLVCSAYKPDGGDENA